MSSGEQQIRGRSRGALNTEIAPPNLVHRGEHDTQRFLREVRRGTFSEQLVDEERNQEVRPAHAGEAESRQGNDRPERHLDFAVILLGGLHCEIHRKNADRKRDGGENAEDEEQEVVRHGNYFFVSAGLINTEKRIDIISTVATIDSAMPMGIG